MNAVLPVSVKDIDSYSDLLSEKFVAETLERSKVNQQHKQDILFSAKEIKNNCSNLSAAMGEITDGFQESSSKFDRLAQVSRVNAEYWETATKNILESVEKIRECSERRKQALKERNVYR